MTSYKRGDVVLVLFPDSNLQTAKNVLRLLFKPTTYEQIYRKSLLQ